MPVAQHEEFENAISLLARASIMPPDSRGNGLAALAAMSADPDGPARRLRSSPNGMNADQVLAAAKGDSARFAVLQRNANESAAIATLKNIASAQEQMQAAAVIDRNGNGAGEFGYFTELAGVADIVGADGKSTHVAPPFLSSAFGKVQDRQIRRSGYVYQMYLPGAGSSFVALASMRAPDRLLHTGGHPARATGPASTPSGSTRILFT